MTTTAARAQFASETSSRGEWVRQQNRFTDRVTRDSTAAPGEGPDAHGRWPVEAGRYRLVVSLACPWAHRSLIVRGLLGLDEAVSLAVVDPVRDDKGWRFALDPDGRDPVLGARYLSEVYLATDPAYSGRVTVPCLVDTLTGKVVTNDYPQLTLDLSTEWVEHHRPGPDGTVADLWPEPERAEMQPLLDAVYADVNNGVYRCGFATTQEAYEEAFDRLFARLDLLEERLGDRRFLMGEEPREVDVRLFTTLVRFDAVYHGHFKANRSKLTELPHLWRYARELYRRPGWGSTVDLDHIKRHYYVTHEQLNPTRVVPTGPEASVWLSD